MDIDTWYVEKMDEFRSCVLKPDAEDQMLLTHCTYVVDVSVHEQHTALWRH